MFSSSKPFGTNCNFLNSVSSSCHEHFKSYHKYLFLNNFTLKGASFLQIFLTMYFPHFFFPEKYLDWKPRPLFLVKGVISCNRKMAPLPISTLSKIKEPGVVTSALGVRNEQRQMASGKTDWNQAINSVPEFQENTIHSTTAVRSEWHLCFLSESYLMYGVHGQENSWRSLCVSLFSSEKWRYIAHTSNQWG